MIGSDNKVVSPWIEKYRPKVLDEVVHQDDVVAVLKKCIEHKNIPNCMFYGPPGTGKTSAISAVARQLFGSHYSKRVLELNASDDRGIKVIREKVKKFSQVSVRIDNSENALPKFKLVILDEADSMTSTAQAALRRIMEKEIHTTRFCIICNYISRIIDPLASRCAKFRFKPLPKLAVTRQLRTIATNENFELEDSALNLIFESSNGDLRKAIMFLHTCRLFYKKDRIELDDVAEVCMVVPKSVVENLISKANGKVENLLESLKSYINSGYSAHQLFNELVDWAIETDSLSELSKSEILNKASIAEAKLNEGADEYLQIVSVFSTLVSIQN